MAALARYAEVAWRGRTRWLSLDTLLRHALLLVTSFLILFPIAMIIYGSLRDASPLVVNNFSLEGWHDLFTAGGSARVLFNTLFLAVTKTIGATGLAILLAWIIHRTDTPGRFWLDKIIYVRFFLPALPMLTAWMVLLAPRSGLINRAGRDYLGLEGPIFNLYSYQGIIFLGVIGWAVFLYIFISPAFQRMDMSLEESSRMSGAGQLTTLRRVTVPLLKPAILAVTLMAFIRMIESFETELFLGAPAGIFVFTTRIFRLLSGEPPHYPEAMAIAALLILITLTLVLIQWKLIGTRQYTTVTGKGFKPTPMALGPLKWVTFSVVVLYLLVDLALPLFGLIFGTFMRVAGLWTAGLTLDNWAKVLGDYRLLTIIRNTLLMSAISATVAVVICALSAYVILRTQYGGRRALDLVTWLPWTVPGLVMALGVLWAYMSAPVMSRFTTTLYGGIWLMVMVRITMSFPITTRIISSSVVQIHRELEESSRTLGASWTRTFTRIWVPLIMPALLAAWLLAFTASVRDVNSVIFLYGAKSQVLSTITFEEMRRPALEIALVWGILQAVFVGLAFIPVVLLGRRIGRVAG